MKRIHAYFSDAYRFMVEVDIRYGVEFHFVTFFLLSVLLPVNVVLVVLLKAEDSAALLVCEWTIAWIAAAIFSFIPGFKRLLRNRFDWAVYPKKKRSFVFYLKGYLLIVGIGLSPCILIVIRLFFDLLNKQ